MSINLNRRSPSIEDRCLSVHILLHDHENNLSYRDKPRSYINLLNLNSSTFPFPVRTDESNQIGYEWYRRFYFQGPTNRWLNASLAMNSQPACKETSCRKVDDKTRSYPHLSLLNWPWRTLSALLSSLDIKARHPCDFYSLNQHWGEAYDPWRKLPRYIPTWKHSHSLSFFCFMWFLVFLFLCHKLSVLGFS